MMQSVVKSIGAEAVNKEEPLLILFDTSATEALKKHAIIQDFEEQEIKAVKVGDTIRFDEQEYKIIQVGPVANQHLKAMGHVSVVFKNSETEDQLANALYVEPFVLPVIKEGTIITYA